MTSFEDSFILLSGGMHDFVAKGIANTDIYIIKDNRWKKGPELNKPRYRHSGCQQGKFIYIYGGQGKGRKNKILSSIERLDAHKSIIKGD